jgi:flavodoxin
MTTLSRRSVLRGAVLGMAAAAAASCSSSGSDADGAAAASPSAGGGSGSGGVLLAYFSRPGENYYNGGRRNLDVGNTEVLAGIMSRLLACDVHRIEAADPYPDSYDETVQRNVREQQADTRPRIANPLPALDRYDTVLLASPIWNVRAPMIMTTFVEGLDLTGKVVHPVVTYAVSGLGTTERDYAESCPGATIREGLAVRGEEAAGARPAVEAWLRRTGLPLR